MTGKENYYNLEQALKAFWKDFGSKLSVNAKHTYVQVEPKFIIGNRVNREVANKLINVYLSQLSSDKVVKEEIVIDNNGFKVLDKGQVMLEVVNPKLMDSMNNEVTSKLGKELSSRQKKSGGAYVDKKEGEAYTFGEIKQALVQFMTDASKNDSKNMLKDAILLLVK